jgi:hypothetical protein
VIFLNTAVGEDHVGRERHQFLGILPDEFAFAGRPAIFDMDIVAVPPAEVGESLAERFDTDPTVRIAFHARQQYADLADGAGPLRPRHERHARRRTAGQRNELASLHR